MISGQYFMQYEFQRQVTLHILHIYIFHYTTRLSVLYNDSLALIFDTGTNLTGTYGDDTQFMLTIFPS